MTRRRVRPPLSPRNQGINGSTPSRRSKGAPSPSVRGGASHHSQTMVNVGLASVIISGVLTTAVAYASSQPLAPISGFTKLSFDDEFSGHTLNTTVWAPVWFHNDNGQNGTRMLRSNVSVSGGMLNLDLRRASGALVSTNPYDGIHGHKGFQFRYGYVQARIYIPAAGTQIANWPAFWTDGQNWPRDGEIDIMEGLDGYAAFHFHYPGGAPGHTVRGHYAGWHTFAANWEPGQITFYYDGIKVGQITKDITSAPMYLLIENSGGRWGGPRRRPTVMKVAWVRVAVVGIRAIDRGCPSQGIAIVRRCLSRAHVPRPRSGIPTAPRALIYRTPPLPM